ncbi:MAG: phenylalanine--tRNA ligase subunit beta, partial [Bacteroidetes bacterium SW_11_45_7]
MKLSHKWLKEYLPHDYSPPQVATFLTDTGLEVESYATTSTVRGGLKGIVIGKVEDVWPHPNADKLKLTRVTIGDGESLQIVCGAPNVAKEQKVVVAPPGTTLYPRDKEPFNVKKAKIRDQQSEGMICAEDEVGLGADHEGIMVLRQDAEPGTNAADYFGIEEDTVFEIDLTPNRAE